MAYNRTQAAKLLTANEMVLFTASLAEAIPSYSSKQLVQKIQRARTLRDKFRDLLRRQKIGTRARTGSKTGLRGDANERTRRKAQIFDEVLQRFTKRLAKLEAASAREAKKAAAAQARALLARQRAAAAGRAAARQVVRSAKAPAQPPASPRAKAGPTSERALAAAKASRLQASRTPAIQGHVSVAGRRNQARRDHRG